MDQVGGDGETIEISRVEGSECVPSGAAQLDLTVDVYRGFAHAHD
jgi:hypothetical protein